MRAVVKWIWKRRSYEQQKAIWGFFYVLPWLIGFLLFFLVPLVQSLRFSLSKVDSQGSGVQIDFIGFDNFVYALTVHNSFNRTFVESIMNMVVNVPLIIIFSMFLAAVLNQKFRGRGIARAIFFLPVVLASGVIASLEAQSLVEALTNETQSGGFVSVLSSFELERMMLEAGVNESFVMYLTGAVDRIYEIVSQSGVQILIFLAGIQSISSHLYEAAKIEGATGYEAFWKITFPMVSPLILVNVVYTVIDSFSRNEMADLVREVGFSNFNFGLSSAMAWIYFIAVSLILAITIWIISRRVFYYE